MVGHGTAAERRGQAGHRGAMADARLVIDGDDAQLAHDLQDRVLLLGVLLRAAQTGNGLGAVDHHAVLLVDEGFVAGLLHMLGDLVNRVVPGDVLPVGFAGPAHLGAVHAVGVQLDFPRIGVHDAMQLEHGGTLRAQAALVDRAVGVAFDIDQLPVAHRADHAATAGTVTADIGGFLGVRQFPVGIGSAFIQAERLGLGR